MSVQTSRFAKLLDLAAAPTSDKRRDLLREVSDLFFETSEARTDRESQLFDDVLRTVANDLQENVLIELAERFAEAPNAPKGLMADLADNRISIAETVLKKCTVLSDEELIAIMARRGQAHINAIAQRAAVSEKLSDAIVARGDDVALDTLMRNDGATLSRGAMETVVDRARVNTKLHEGVVKRKDLHLDLLNEMYFVVEARLRETILQRNANVDPAELDAALAKSRTKVRQAVATISADQSRAEAFIRTKKQANELKPGLLVALYRDRQVNHFLYGLAELTGVDFETCRQIIGRKDFDALATICRAANIERPLFVTLAVICLGGENAMAKAEEFGRIYNSVPVEAAQRAVRFFKVRQATEADKTAAA